jgi:hypothetical protein
MKILLIFALLLSGCANHNRDSKNASPAPSPTSPSPSPTVDLLKCDEFSLPKDLLGAIEEKEVALRMSQYIANNEKPSLSQIEKCLDQQLQISCENHICTITGREK